VTWFQSDKARALLAYLAVEAATPHARHALAGLLWPDFDDRHALHSLSQALCSLRSVLHDHDALPPCLDIAPHTIQFNGAADCWLDVAEFGRLVHWGSGKLVRRSGGGDGRLVYRSDDDQCRCREPTNLPTGQSTVLSALHQAVSLYRGPFLQDLSLGDSNAFEEWAAIQRERLHRLLMAALYRLAEEHEARGELEEALDCAHRQVELDPWREEAHIQAMRLLACAGRRSEALVQYHLCRRVLLRELGAEPGAATTRLYEQIRDGGGMAAGADRWPGRPGGRDGRLETQSELWSTDASARLACDAARGLVTQHGDDDDDQPCQERSAARQQDGTQKTSQETGGQAHDAGQQAGADGQDGLGGLLTAGIAARQPVNARSIHIEAHQQGA
jgi:DNA-binding SARP family transcriptional activator